MTRFVVLSLAALLLASCAAPGPYAYATPAPGEAAFLASGTMTAVATYDYATRVEYTRQAVAFSDATAQAVYATQAAVAATQAAATATAQTREAATAAAATVTAQAVQATQAVVAMQTRDAGWEATRRTALETQATATALAGAAEQDRQERTRGALWGWLALLAAAGFLFALFRLLYSLAAGRLAESRIIRNARTGEPVAYRHRDGALEYLMEPEPIPALPAPNGDGSGEDYLTESDYVNTNWPRPNIHPDDIKLRHNGMMAVFSREQYLTLRRWYLSGHRRIRRDKSTEGPSFQELPSWPPVSSGRAYNTIRAVLLGKEYITEQGDWTALGASEFLGVQPVPPSSSSSSRLPDGGDGIDRAGWGG